MLKNSVYKKKEKVSSKKPLIFRKIFTKKYLLVANNIKTT